MDIDMDMDIDQLVDRYIAVWNESDPTARRRATSALWDPEGVETTASARYHGHDALEVRIAQAHNDLLPHRADPALPLTRPRR